MLKKLMMGTALFVLFALPGVADEKMEDVPVAADAPEVKAPDAPSVDAPAAPEAPLAPDTP